MFFPNLPSVSAKNHSQFARMRRAARGIARLILIALTVSCISVYDFASATEEEEPRARPKKKIVIEEEEEVPKTPARKTIRVEETSPPLGEQGLSLPSERLEDVEAERVKTTNPAIRAFLNHFTRAYDRVVIHGQSPQRIRPVPFWLGLDPAPRTLSLAVLDDMNSLQEPVIVQLSQVQTIDPFEVIVLAEVNRWLKDTQAGATLIERLAAAETLLAATLRFHDWARDNNVRVGRYWNRARDQLYEKLREVRLQRYRLISEQNPQMLAAESSRLVSLYPKDPAVLEEITFRYLRDAERTLTDGSLEQLQGIRMLLTEFESQFPKAQTELVRRLRSGLSAKAQQLFSDAKQEHARGRHAAAQELLRTALGLDPDLPGLREFQGQLRSDYQILSVAVPQLPKDRLSVRLSPSTARLDSERYGVELLFEGLYQELPDLSGGVSYHPALAAGPLHRTETGCELTITRGATWANAEKTPVLASDLAGTLRLLQDRPELWCALPALRWWEHRVISDLPGQASVIFKQPHPDLRAALTFKVLPVQWFVERNKRLDDAEFARLPFGSGPFRFAGYRPADAANKAALIFQENPLYAQRPGRLGQPILREIHISETPKSPTPPALTGQERAPILNVTQLAEEFKSGHLHIVTDVPTRDIPFLEASQQLLTKYAELHTQRQHRRVHILAINHRRPALQNPDLRRGLSLAIDREAILRTVIAPSQASFHTAMTGPFPPLSWATPKDERGQRVPLFNPDLARVKLEKYLREEGRDRQLTLTVPANDPLAVLIGQKIIEQIQAVAPLNLALLPVLDFASAVCDEHRYDLAYLPLDYPDDWYPIALADFLDPSAAIRGGRNYLGYLTPGTVRTVDDQRLAESLAEIRLYRDLAGELAPRAREIHRRFNETVPFIPLWQLDRHMLFAKNLRVMLPTRAEAVPPSVLNPLVLFQGISRWRLE